MNKKYLSVILFGALMLGATGTFTSCTDYDDDIANLQTQIDKQNDSLNKTLSEKLAAVESSISSLQSAQSSLDSKIAAAEDAAEKAALEAQKQAIETAKTELNTVKAELQAAIQANTGEIADVKAAVTSIEGEISTLQAAQKSLESEIAAAKDAAEKAVLEAKNEAIEAAKTELAAVKAELQASIQENKDAIAAVDAAVKALEKKVTEDMAKVVGRVEALEAFQTTTEETLDKLAEADEALSNSITELETELKAELVALGTRLTAVEAQIAALQSYKADIDANKEGVAANKEAIDKLVTDLAALEAGKLTDEMIEEIAKRVMDIVSNVNAKVEVISSALKKQVTHVSLYTKANEGVASNDLILNLVSAEAVRTWTFGEGLEGAISFTKGNKETFEDSFVIRVSPTTATLDKYMIRLVNSQMKDLSNLLEVKSIEPYTELLTKTVSQNGLWEVTVKLKDNYDTKAYNDAATTYQKDGKTPDKSILYAVMVSGEEHDGREVVSEYGLTLAQLNKGTKHELFFNVDKQSVTKIHNRWNGTGSSASEDGTSVSYEELAWDMTPDGGNYKYAPWAEPITEGNGKNVVTDDNDKRQLKPAYSVVAGKPFTVNFDEAMAYTIRGFYVTLDEACAVESEPSEVNAWRSYHVKGLNTVTSESSLELTIPEDVNADGDYIGFRVYAVNYDGSLVDPDGKAFYVYVGVPAENWNAVNTVVVPGATLGNTPNSAKSADVAVTLTKLDAPHHATWLDEEGEEPIFDAYFVAGSATYNTTASGLNTISVDFTKVTKIYTKPRYDGTAGKTWADIKDGKAYNGTLTIYNVHGSVLATINITMTKQLPTAPEGFSVKTNQLDASGIYNCYLIPDNWTAPSATNGTMDMDYVFNWGAGVPAQYVISFAKAKKASGKDVANEVAGGADLTVAKDYIDNKTQHATVVSYNFGKISSETKDEDENFADYKVEVKTFPTVFNCIYNDTYTWSWDNKAANDIATNTKLVYGSDYKFKNKSGVAYNFDEAIKGTSSKDGAYSALLSTPYKNSLVLQKANLISKGNGVEDEYFTVDTSDMSFKAKTGIGQTNPTANVPSTLKLVYKDMYNHDVVIELDMTVVPR